MPLLYVISLILVVSGGWLGLSASDAYSQYVATENSNAQLQQEIEGLKARNVELQNMAPGPVRPSVEALSVFYSRMLEAGEVLGAAVRIESRGVDVGQNTLLFEDPGGGEVGLQVCRARLSAAMEGDDSIPIMSMMEEELQDLPVTVTAVTARRSGGDLTLLVDVDVFGMAQREERTQ
jgi:hypothetical protein